MGQVTNIQWTDSTWSPWRGCTKVSAGCANCYAERLVTTRMGGKWGKGSPRVRAAKATFNAPLRWNKNPWVCDEPYIGWGIVGGESGPNRREAEGGTVEAIADIVRQCQAAGVPCFVKQDCAAKPGQQGRLPDDVWAVKQFPVVRVEAAA